MAFSNFYLTAKGRELLALAQTGTQLTFTRVQIGEGIWPDGTTYDNITALVKPVKYLSIVKMTGAAGQAKITVDFTNSGVGRSFNWTECALFAADPEAPTDRSRDILYGAAYAGGSPVPIEAALTEFRYNIILTVSRASNVSVIIDSSMVYVSQTDLEERLKDIGGGLVVIPTGTVIPPEERKRGYLYFRVTEEHTLSVSEDMTLKFGEET